MSEIQHGKESQAEKWAEDARQRAVNTDYWKGRAEKAELQVGVWRETAANLAQRLHDVKSHFGSIEFCSQEPCLEVLRKFANDPESEGENMAKAIKEAAYHDFIREMNMNAVLSEKYKDRLIELMFAAHADAFERGRKSVVTGKPRKSV